MLIRHPIYRSPYSPRPPPISSIQPNSQFADSLHYNQSEKPEQYSLTPYIRPPCPSNQLQNLKLQSDFKYADTLHYGQLQSDSQCMTILPSTNPKPRTTVWLQIYDHPAQQLTSKHRHYSLTPNMRTLSTTANLTPRHYSPTTNIRPP